MDKYNKIELSKEDLRKIIYFILMKFRSDALHVQGTSSKRDFLGGYIERWFNKIAETVIFNELLKNKDYEIVSDYFLYANDSDKNAPDILGLKKSNKQIIPFVQYNEGTWTRCEDLPRIEIKAIRKDQALLGIREPQMIDDYYMFIESDLEEDYLNTIFEKEIFNKKYLKELEIQKEFIKSDSKNQLIPHSEMKQTEKIGSMRLIGIYTLEEIKNKFTLCTKGVKPYYFSSITQEFKIKIKDMLEKERILLNNGMCNYKYENEIYLPFNIQGDNNLSVIKKNKGSFYINSDKPLNIEGIKTNPGITKIEFKKFDRSSNWDENIALKSFIEAMGNDSTDELINLFDTIEKRY